MIKIILEDRAVILPIDKEARRGNILRRKRRRGGDGDLSNI